jgi:outer membrane protein
MMKQNAFALGLLGFMAGFSMTQCDEKNPAKQLAAPIIEDKAQVKDLKIRFMDVFAAMRESEEGVEATAKLDLKRQELGKEAEAKSKKIEQARTEFKAKASTMNEAARAKKDQELARMARDFESDMQGYDEEMKLVGVQVTEVLAKEVEQSVTEIAKKEGLDAVIDKVTGRVVYTSGKADCTAQVIQSMNKNLKVKLARNEKSAASTVTLASNKKAGSVTA